MTCGTCAPSNGNEYDGTCAAPSKVITLTGTRDADGGEVGRPHRRQAPAQLHRREPRTRRRSPRISWVAAVERGRLAAEYKVDITIDNLKYTTN